MKKIISLFTVLMLLASPCFSAWDETAPAGSSAAADIDTNVGANNTALEDTLEDMRGWVNLKVVRDSVTQVTVTADEIWLQKSGDLSRNFSTVSEAIAITSSGASGLDTGSEANVWYYIWIIAKDDNTIDGLISASATSPTMPSGYTYKTLVSAVHNTSGDFVDFKQYDCDYWYTAWPTAASGNVGTSSWVSVDLTAYVPSSLSDIVSGYVPSYGSVTGVVGVTNDNTVADYDDQNPTRNRALAYDDSHCPILFTLNILTANTLYWVSGASGAKLFISGFKINKL